MKKFFSLFGEFVFLAIFVGSITFTFISWLDSTVADECSSCSATYEWCDSYWEDKGLCGRNNHE